MYFGKAMESLKTSSYMIFHEILCSIRSRKAVDIRLYGSWWMVVGVDNGKERWTLDHVHTRTFTDDEKTKPN